MNHKKGTTLVVFCTGLLLFSGLTAAETVLADSGSDERIVRVDVEGMEDMKRLNRLDLDIIDRSGRHALVETDEATIEKLRKSEVRVNTLPGRTEISVKGHTFDFTEGEPEFDPELKIDEYPEGSTGTYIVHMLGPVNPEWRASLEEMGVDILNYVPNYAYEVRMTPEKRERVEALDFVDWTGIYHPGYRIEDDIEPGRIQVTLVPDVDTETFERRLEKLQIRNSGAVLIDSVFGWRATLDVDDMSSIDDIAGMQDVYYVSQYDEPELLSEVDSQIIGGGTWIMDDEDGDPGTAYRKHGDHGAYINQIGYTGEGVTVAVADTGLGDGTEGDAGHPDFGDRVVGGYSYTGQGDWQDGHSHGTHCAGSVAGDTYGGTGTQYDGLDGEFYVSQGLASDSELYVMKIFTDDGQFIPESYHEIVEQTVRRSDSYIHSNSWGGEGDGSYGEADEEYDHAVRDAHSMLPSNEPMVITVAAGNAGPGEQTIGSPGNAKNVITVGATETYMPDAGNYGGSGGNNPDNVVDFSSRGWTEDGRVKPDVVAPGESILSTMTPEDTGNGGGRGGYMPAVDNEPTDFGGGYTEDGRYEWMSGTSMSNPAVAGAASVVVEWYEENYGETPSPAMVKALLINTAHDLDDENGNTGPIPNPDEGWGMVDISKLEYPKEDPVPFQMHDQPTQLQTGEVDEYQVMTGKEDEPLKVSLVWTDKNAQAGDEETLKNDLNLEVESPGGELYRGNAFSGGWTPPGENAMTQFDSTGDGWDDTNNVENVYIDPDQVEDGIYNISVEGFNIPEDANDDGNASQDYALVVYNGPLGPDVDIASPASDQIIRESDVTVEWTSERAEKHEIRLNEDAWIDVGMDTTYTFEEVEDGNDHRVEIRATDRLEDNTTESVTFSVWTVDVEVSSPEEGEIFADDEVIVYWASDYAESHMIRLNEEDWIEVGMDTSYPFEGLGDGNHTVEVRAIDAAGYQSTRGVNFTVDTIPPEINITSPEEDHISSDRSVTIEWEGSDEVSGVEGYEIRRNEGDWQDIGNETLYGYDDLSDGDHEVDVRVTDRAGNLKIATVNFTIDTRDPVIWINEPDPDPDSEKENIINSDSITVSWNAEDEISGIDELGMRIDKGADGNWDDWIELGTTYLFSLNRTEYEEYLEEGRIDETLKEGFEEEGYEVESDAVISEENGEWFISQDGTRKYRIESSEDELNIYGTELEHTFEDLPEGDHLVEVHALDLAGNEQSRNVSFTVDTVAPELEITSPSDDGEQLRTDFATIEWDYEEFGSDIERFEIRIDGGEWIDVGRDTSYTFEDIEDGSYTVEVRATDQAGNNETKTVSFEVDRSSLHIYWANYWWLILPLVIIILTAVGIKTTKKIKGSKKEEDPPPPPEKVSDDTTSEIYKGPQGKREKRSRAQSSASTSTSTPSNKGSGWTSSSKDRGKPCPTCGSRMKWFDSSKKWYCKECQQYKESKRTGPVRKKEKGRKKEQKQKDEQRQSEVRSKEKIEEEEEKNKDESRCPLCGVKIDPESEECRGCGLDLTEEE